MRSRLLCVQFITRVHVNSINNLFSFSSCQRSYKTHLCVLLCHVNHVAIQIATQETNPASSFCQFMLDIQENHITVGFPYLFMFYLLDLTTDIVL